MTFPPHGTYARYQVEVKSKAGTCDACKAANRDYRLRDRSGRYCSVGLGWPVTAAYAEPIRTCLRKDGPGAMSGAA